MKTNKINNQAGFTLIELILVVAIIGMLTAAIAPSFTTLLADTSEASAKGLGGQIQSAINIRFAENLAGGTSTSPGAFDLDGLASGSTCSTTNTCFDNVSSVAMTSSSWRKASGSASATDTDTYTYAAPSGAGNLTFTYTPGTANAGTFICTGSAGSISCN